MKIAAVSSCAVDRATHVNETCLGTTSTYPACPAEVMQCFHCAITLEPKDQTAGIWGGSVRCSSSNRASRVQNQPPDRPPTVIDTTGEGVNRGELASRVQLKN